MVLNNCQEDIQSIRNVHQLTSYANETSCHTGRSVKKLRCLLIHKTNTGTNYDKNGQNNHGSVITVSGNF